MSIDTSKLNEIMERNMQRRRELISRAASKLEELKKEQEKIESQIRSIASFGDLNVEGVKAESGETGRKNVSRIAPRGTITLSIVKALEANKKHPMPATEIIQKVKEINPSLNNKEADKRIMNVLLTSKRRFIKKGINFAMAGKLDGALFERLNAENKSEKRQLAK